MKIVRKLVGKMRNGFSLVEMTVVLTILAVLGGVLVYMVFGGGPSHQLGIKLQGDIKTMVVKIRFAQQATVSSQIPHTVQFIDDPSGQDKMSYKIWKWVEDRHSPTGYSKPDYEEDDPLEKIKLTPPVKFDFIKLSEGVEEITFTNIGGTVGPTSGYIVLAVGNEPRTQYSTVCISPVGYLDLLEDYKPDYLLDEICQDMPVIPL